MKHFLCLQFFFLIAFSPSLTAQIRLHSHNDYDQSVPFWTAFASNCQSIEADLYLKDGTLFVTHAKGEIKAGRTLEQLYLDPLSEAIKLNGGELKEPLQLLLDLKSGAEKTLDALIKVLEGYPGLIKNKQLSFVISGNRPPARDYTRYPEYILFDYQSLESDENTPWDKIALISLNFRHFSRWNGLGRLTHEDLKRVKAVVEKAHQYEKPFRFWATPDTKTAWRAMMELGVDYLNTDHPFEASSFLMNLNKHQAENLSVDPVYRPAYAHQSESTPQNIILMIGDGNGLSQISAAFLTNKNQLNLTQIKDIGLVSTVAADDLVTDSAAAATAIASGQKTNNRAIGTDSLGNPLESVVEHLGQKGFATGIVTNDDLTGATPAAFYAHQMDRGQTEEIEKDLKQSRLNLYIGGKNSLLPQELTSAGIDILDQFAELERTSSDRAAFFWKNSDTIHLPEVTKKALAFMTKKSRPFFLMIEGAHIDSYGHANEMKGVVQEVLEFDRAVAQAIKFVDQQKSTLLLVTADHETGGLALLQGDQQKNRIQGGFNTNDHTASLVPLFAYGPGSQALKSNLEVYTKTQKSIPVCSAC